MLIHRANESGCEVCVGYTLCPLIYKTTQMWKPDAGTVFCCHSPAGRCVRDWFLKRLSGLDMYRDGPVLFNIFIFRQLKKKIHFFWEGILIFWSQDTFFFFQNIWWSWSCEGLITLVSQCLEASAEIKILVYCALHKPGNQGCQSICVCYLRDSLIKKKLLI